MAASRTATNAAMKNTTNAAARITTLSDLQAIQQRIAKARELRPGGATVRITVHMGTCGIASGAKAVLDAAREALRESDRKDVVITTSGCIGLCSEEPLVTVERLDWEPIIYHRVGAGTMRTIFQEHVCEGHPHAPAALARGLAVCDRPPDPHSPYEAIIPHVWQIPFFALQKLWVLRNKGLIDPDEIDDYIWRDGYQGACKALLEMEPREIISEVKESGLRGRGGGGFPTGLKWDFCAAAKGDVRYTLCNADEGDPGAFMDRSVMEGDPHAVLEGMLIASRAIGSHQGYIYCRAEYPLAVQRLERAIEQARAYGLLGRNIFGTGHDFDVEVYQGAGAFVCGEETALMRSIEGQRGTPRPRPPFPAISGLWRKPTVLNNVETYANVGQIVLRGGAAYARLGTESSKGTKVFALTGKVRRVGLVEVPMGTTLGRIIFDIGGGMRDGKKFKAVQLGGPSGGCVPAEHLNTPIDYEAIIKIGAIIGSGGMIVMDEDSCMVDMARYFMEFCADESCGKCSPCRIGTTRMLQLLQKICRGQGELRDVELLEDLAATLKDTSLCGLGQTAPNPVLSTLRYFRSEYDQHIKAKRCPAVACCDLFISPCQGICPVGMDVPGYIGLIRAGRLDDAFKLLKKTNPLPSVCGRVCGHPCQAKCRRGQVDEPVAIMHLKRFITDHARRPRIKPLPFTRPEKVAIVGAGPSGLTAAWELRKRGYHVTIFEALSEAGGMLRWGIPAYRLPRNVLDRDIQDILHSGVELRLNTRIGRDVQFSDLQAQYDAIYIAVGAQASPALGIPGEKAEGVYGAVEFLRDYNMDRVVRIGRRVAVIGGGNSAVDAARCAVRLGADEVTIHYRRERHDMPAIAWEVQAAQQEGVRLEFLVAPTEIVAREGRVAGLRLVRMRLDQFDRSGRKRPEPIPNSDFVVEADTVIAAVGQSAELDFVPAPSGVKIDRDVICVDDALQTANAKIWAGGDIVTGPAMVVDAIQAGQRVAHSIDAAIRQAKDQKPWQDPWDEEIEIPLEMDEQVVEQPQTAMPTLAADERKRSFAEVEQGYTLEMAMAEARRCRRCDGGAAQTQAQILEQAHRHVREFVQEGQR
jgi:NADH-quinone oxidoreductase subunit F